MSGVMMPQKKEGGMGQVAGAMQTAKSAYDLYQGVDGGTKKVGTTEDQEETAMQRRMKAMNSNPDAYRGGP